MTSSSGTGNSALQPEGRVGARSRCLRSIPSDSIVNVEMKFDTLSGYHHRVDLVVRRRTLLEFSNPQARVGSTGDARMGVRTVVVLPWETWGPTNSRILDNSSFWPAWLSGDRRAVALPSHITMRDYNPYRVRRALTLLGGDGREVNLACGSMVKVVKEASVYRGGECFYNDVVTSLPYVETVTPYKGCHGVSMDENYMVVEVVAHDTVSPVYLHSSIKALSDKRTSSRQNESSISILCGNTDSYIRKTGQISNVACGQENQLGRAEASELWLVNYTL